MISVGKECFSLVLWCTKCPSFVGSGRWMPDRQWLCIFKSCPVELTGHHAYSGWQGQMWLICCDTLLHHQCVARGDSCLSSDVFICCRTAQRRPDEPCHCSHCCQVRGCHGQLPGGSPLAQEDRPPNREGACVRCPVQGCTHRYAQAVAARAFWASCLAYGMTELYFFLSLLFYLSQISESY